MDSPRQGCQVVKKESSQNLDHLKVGLQCTFDRHLFFFSSQARPELPMCATSSSAWQPCRSLFFPLPRKLERMEMGGGGREGGAKCGRRLCFAASLLLLLLPLHVLIKCASLAFLFSSSTTFLLHLLGMLLKHAQDSRPHLHA